MFETCFLLILIQNRSAENDGGEEGRGIVTILPDRRKKFLLNIQSVSKFALAKYKRDILC